MIKLLNQLIKKIDIGILIDLSKAFDTINHRILLAKLQHYGVRGIALSWFCHYLSNRKQYVFHEVFFQTSWMYIAANTGLDIETSSFHFIY